MLRRLIFLFLVITLCAPAGAAAAEICGNICRSGDPAVTRVQLESSPFLPNFTPIPLPPARQKPHVPLGPLYQSQSTSTPCVDTEKRFGYRGYQHCRLHPQYQVAFKNWNCQCYTGQCRPTKFRKSNNPESETGYEIYVNGEYFELPKAAMRTEKANMTEDLLEYDAHVCSNDPPKPHIECGWINLPS